LKAGVFEDFRDIGTKTDDRIETNGLYRWLKSDYDLKPTT
jgi:hypothetical protein